MLVQLNVLQMVLVLLLRRKRQFGALVQCLSITFPRYSHHHVFLIGGEDRPLLLHNAVMLSCVLPVS